MKLFFATTNQGKLRDFAAVADTRFTFNALPGMESLTPPAEDEPTFTGNAVQKAIFYSQHAEPELLVVADDSGLEVTALGGAPGVRSARYAEDRGFTSRREMAVDRRNNLCLLDALATVREGDRQARYCCALAIAKGGEVIATAEGSVEGEIVAVPRGNGGFGYDPLFLLPELGQTMGEVGEADRLEHSHRGRALQALLAKLEATQEIAQSGR